MIREGSWWIITDCQRQPEDLKEYGTREYDFIAGAGTKLSYKGIQLSVNVDIKTGRDHVFTDQRYFGMGRNGAGYLV